MPSAQRQLVALGLQSPLHQRKLLLLRWLRRISAALALLLQRLRLLLL
jgi:hypothetical protein